LHGNAVKSKASAVIRQTFGFMADICVMLAAGPAHRNCVHVVFIER